MDINTDGTVGFSRDSEERKLSVDEALKWRKSCRDYESKDLPEHIHEHLLWAASRAPYGSRGPRREVFSFRSYEVRKILREFCFNQRYVEECSAVYVFCGKDFAGKRGSILKSGHPKYVFDVGAAAMCMDLAATAKGLGTCWIGWFDADKVQSFIKTSYKPTIILLVGYPK